MKQPKKLKRIHNQFLSEQGLRSKDYRFVSESPESYTFYNVRMDKEETFRR